MTGSVLIETVMVTERVIRRSCQGSALESAPFVPIHCAGLERLPMHVPIHK